MFQILKLFKVQLQLPTTSEENQAECETDVSEENLL